MRVIRVPILYTLKRYFLNISASALAFGLSSSIANFTSIYLTIYLTKFCNWPLHKALLLISSCLIVCSIGTLLSGQFSLKLGASRILNASAVFLLIFIFPLLFLTNWESFFSVFISQGILNFFLGTFYGAIPKFAFDLFPTHVRYTGVAMSDALGKSLLGGVAPMAFLYLTSALNAPWGASFFLIFITVLFLICFWLSTKRSSKKAIEKKT